MKTLFLILLLIFIGMKSYAQNKDIISLWPEKVPGEPKEKNPPVIAASKNDNVLRLAQVTDPTGRRSWLRVTDGYNSCRDMNDTCRELAYKNH